MTNLEGRYYQDVGELAEAISATNANEKLKDGWELLSIKERTTEMQATGGVIVRTEPVYIFGRKSATKQTPQQAGTPSSGNNTTAKKSYCKDYTRKDGTVVKGCGAELVWVKVDERMKPFSKDGSPHVHEASTK